jgi:acetylornithine/succinyldiaminopimelate/putrescine aminotransferase
MSFDELAALDAAHVMGTYARQPVAFVRGEGSRLWDSEGREYLDFLGGLAVLRRRLLGRLPPLAAPALLDRGDAEQLVGPGQARPTLHDAKTSLASSRYATAPDDEPA